MTTISQRLLALYLACLIALAALGAHNQLNYLQHEALLGQKASLQLQLSGLRQEAAGVTGALAVRRWALARGMVPAPEALNIREIAASPAPTTPVSQGRLELYTLWR